VITGIDVSSYQGAIRWQEVAATGRVAFAFTRAFHSQTPGDYGNDVKFTENHDGCTKSGIPFGVYFYFIVAQDGVTQADHLLQVADGRFGTLAPVVDVEEGSGAQGWGPSVSTRIANLGACLQRVASTVAEPMIYTNQDTWNNYFGGTQELAKYRLWIADPHSPAGHPKNMPRGWSTWTIHQYSTGSIDGIDGQVDLDYLNSENVKSILSQ
jgi:GH25 family lysozyme M1 (1,4-beta-N-acetylmuramidase)